MRAWQVLALAGSLRSGSRNRALLEAAGRIAPPALRIELYDGLGQLPLFNPDVDAAASRAVARLEAAVRASDALLIACPEYAHGVPGAFKNALDWLVGGEAFVNKPLALWNTAPRARHAQQALAEIVTTMSGRLLPEAGLALPLLGTTVDAAAIAADPAMRAAIQAALIRYAAALRLLQSHDAGKS